MAVSTKVQTTEIEVISKNHQILVMELDLSVVKEENNVLYILVHFRDITKRKKSRIGIERRKMQIG